MASYVDFSAGGLVSVAANVLDTAVAAVDWALPFIVQIAAFWIAVKIVKQVIERLADEIDAPDPDDADDPRNYDWGECSECGAELDIDEARELTDDEGNSYCEGCFRS